MTVVDMETAISSVVRDGQEIYIAGFTHMIPHAAGNEIIRQGFRDLTLSRATPSIVYDKMIAAGCARKVVFSYAGAGLRRALEEGTVEFEEYTHFGMVTRLAAGAYNLPFLPVRTFNGTDLPRYNDRIEVVESPYSGEEIHVVPPLNPDVTIVHTHRADKHGNGQAWGIIGDIIDSTLAADTVVLTTEEIVDESVIRSDPNRTVVPGSAVDYVVEEPYACHPSYVQGCYDRDRSVYREWDAIASTEEGVQEHLDEWVYGVDNHREYLEKLGAGRLLDLEPDTNYATPIDMGGYQ